ncbi:MAG TPA: hypothetical protein GXZ91_08070 [Christensenellaceae bacterium]|nr:hypothetical protein [Christensenellaceae bacterium]
MLLWWKTREKAASSEKPSYRITHSCRSIAKSIEFSSEKENSQSEIPERTLKR